MDKNRQIFKEICWREVQETYAICLSNFYKLKVNTNVSTNEPGDRPQLFLGWSEQEESLGEEVD